MYVITYKQVLIIWQLFELMGFQPMKQKEKMHQLISCVNCPSQPQPLAISPMPVLKLSQLL